MLDLEPRVHLEEVELAAHVDEELHGARVHVAGRAGHPTRRLTEALAQRRVHEGRRRFLDELLVPALDRALALAEVDHVTVAIGERECRSEEHTSELQSPDHVLCRLLPKKKKQRKASRARRTCILRNNSL